MKSFFAITKLNTSGNIFLYILVIVICISCYENTKASIEVETGKCNKMISWRPGNLDIHFIHTGRGNTSLIIFPDGTTLLFDAGDAKQREKYPYYPSLLDSSKSTGRQIADYISRFMPKKELDYALISHFHSDHYGEIIPSRSKSVIGGYRLSGITELGDLIKINTIIDRGYPDYKYPDDRKFKPGPKDHLAPNKEIDSTFLNYLDFISFQKKSNGLEVAGLDVGSNDQIQLLYNQERYPGFEIRNLKSNNEIWTGIGDKKRQLVFDPPFVNEFGYYNENPLSLALKISYGDFDYYVGGDTSGTNDYPDYDIEAELLEIIGEVDAMTLNHHGHHDSSSLRFLMSLNPQAIAHQCIHDPHFPEIVQENLLKSKADVFTMSIGKNIRKRDGERIDRIYKSTEGNFVIRVSPNGKTFEIIILNPEDNSSVKEVFGPYISRN